MNINHFKYNFLLKLIFLFSLIIMFSCGADQITPAGWFSWGANSLWQVLDTIYLGQYLPVDSHMAASKTVYFPTNQWKSQFDGDTGTYNFFFRAFNTWTSPTGVKMNIYSKDTDRYVNGAYHPIQEIYVNRELFNVCLAVTEQRYWPSFYNRIKATTEEK